MDGTSMAALRGIPGAFVAAGLLALGTLAHAQGYTITDLGGLGGSYSIALAVNGGGAVAGNAFVAGDGAMHAFMYREGRAVDLGTLGGPASYVESIDDDGRVYGTSSVAGDADGQHRFVYENGAMRDLGPARGARVAADPHLWTARAGSGTAVHAFLYRGFLQDLGTLGGPASFGYDVNAFGQAVGSSNVPGDDGAHAFVYRDGRMLDLNALTRARDAGWILQSARAINESGQIVGFGLHDGRTAAFLLTPADRPQVASR
jgi:probable HAF family extracellular repeat protein